MPAIADLPCAALPDFAQTIFAPEAGQADEPGWRGLLDAAAQTVLTP